MSKFFIVLSFLYSFNSFALKPYFDALFEQHPIQSISSEDIQYFGTSVNYTIKSAQPIYNVLEGMIDYVGALSTENEEYRVIIINHGEGIRSMLFGDLLEDQTLRKGTLLREKDIIGFTKEKGKVSYQVRDKVIALNPLDP